jgi:hypothetical protein
VLTGRALNRATLHRQLLLERVRMPAYDAARHLVGLQAQVPVVPYISLWNRLDGFDPAELSGLMVDRSVVRTPLMRTTIHTVTAADALAMRPLMQPVLTRTFAGTSFGQQLRGDDLAKVVATARELISEQPLGRAELGRLLHERYGHLDADSMALAVSYLVPAVQPTPRGEWGRSGRPAWLAVEAWLDGRAEPAMTPDDLVVRYLTAFGPASVKDIQAWCGLTRLREVVDRLGDRIRRLSGPDGRELVDVPDGPLPDPETPAPPRFFGEYDNAILGYADRARIVADAPHQPLQGGTGGYVGSLLVDGLVSAMWALRRAGDSSVLEIRQSVPLPKAHRSAVLAEAAGLLELLAPGRGYDVQVTGPG